MTFEGWEGWSGADAVEPVEALGSAEPQKTVRHLCESVDARETVLRGPARVDKLADGAIARLGPERDEVHRHQQRGR
jgi:hypothetical protein